MSWPPAKRACSECRGVRNHEDYSRNQWSKGIGISRCKWCVEGRTPPVNTNRPTSARENKASRALIYDMHRPFAQGAFRFVAKGEYTDGSRCGQACVAKWFKSGGVFEETFFKSDIQAVDPALRIVDQWNAMKFINKHIVLNKPAVWKMVDGNRVGERMLVEPFINHWEKFNSNSGWNSDGMQWGRVMQALSHYSYHVSSGQFVLCDLQGGIVSNGAILTDPVILSRSRSYGVTDLGGNGIRNFFGHHVCNEFCRPTWTRPKDAMKIYAPKEGTSMVASKVATRPSRQPMTVLETYYDDEYDDY